MSICTTWEKIELQRFLYEQGAKVPPVLKETDDDGIDEYCAEGEKEADELVSMDIEAAGIPFAVHVRKGGEWSAVYEGDDFAAALEAYRSRAVETTLPL